MNSLWLSENSDNKNYENLNKDISTDVCIIGAGIFGLTCGYYLSKSGFKVTIVDKSDICRKTTGHTTAKITSQHGLFYSYLIDTYGEQFAKDYLSANEEAIRNIKNIIDTENIKCDFENQSNFVYTTDKLEVVKIKKEVDIPVISNYSKGKGLLELEFRVNAIYASIFDYNKQSLMIEQEYKNKPIMK